LECGCRPRQVTDVTIRTKDPETIMTAWLGPARIEVRAVIRYDHTRDMSSRFLQQNISDEEFRVGLVPIMHTDHQYAGHQ
jgi:hypothetical protein